MVLNRPWVIPARPPPLSSPTRYRDQGRISAVDVNVPRHLRLFAFYLTSLEHGGTPYPKSQLHPSEHLQDLLTIFNGCPLLDLCQKRGVRGPYMPQVDNLGRVLTRILDDCFLPCHFIDPVKLNEIADSCRRCKTFNPSSVPWNNLALNYAILALGSRTAPDVVLRDLGIDRQSRATSSLEWLRAARALVDPAECHRSLIALQTVLCMIELLRVTCQWNTCSAFLQHAAAAAIRMGLHQMQENQSDCDRQPCYSARTFKALRILDSTICPVLGRPCYLQETGTKLITQHSPTSIASEKLEDLCLSAHLELLDIYVDASRSYDVLEDLVRLPVASIEAVTLVQGIHARLELWIARHSALLYSDSSLSPSENSVRLKLHLTATYSNIYRIIFFPFVRRIMLTTYTPDAPCRGLDDLAKDCAMRCVEGAIASVQAAELRRRVCLVGEPPALFVQHLAEARTVILIAQCFVNDKSVAERLNSVSKIADQLLENAGSVGRTASAVFQSLMKTLLVGSYWPSSAPHVKIEDEKSISCAKRGTSPTDTKTESTIKSKRPRLGRSASSDEFWTFIDRAVVEDQK